MVLMIDRLQWFTVIIVMVVAIFLAMVLPQICNSKNGHESADDGSITFVVNGDGIVVDKHYAVPQADDKRRLTRAKGTEHASRGILCNQVV